MSPYDSDSLDLLIAHESLLIVVVYVVQVCIHLYIYNTYPSSDGVHNNYPNIPFIRSSSIEERDDQLTQCNVVVSKPSLLIGMALWLLIHIC